MRSYLHIFVLLLALSRQVTSEKATDTEYERQPSWALESNILARDGCFGTAHVSLEGSFLLQRPLAVHGPDECCAACQERSDRCAGWEFSARTSTCLLLAYVHTTRRCMSSDCVAGIIKKNQHEVMNRYPPIPSERYDGIQTSCEERSYFDDIGAVVMACAEIRRRCDGASRKVSRLPIEKVSRCRFHRDVNYYGKDYNVGYIELTRSPEECCLRCKRRRACKAWSRLESGQCWLKYAVPSEVKRKVEVGTVSGIVSDTRYDAKCGKRFEGYFPKSDPNKDMEELPASSPDECCQLCTNRTSVTRFSRIGNEGPTDCVLWSFFNGTCRRFYSNKDPILSDQVQPGAVSAYMVTVPPHCDGDEGSPRDVLEIARSIDVDCASILLNGPDRIRSGCMTRKDAATIFRDTIDSTRSLTGRLFS